MPTKIYPSSYKDQAAIAIETERVRALFLPGIGAKLTSLVYKPLNYELLIQRPIPNYLLQPFDGNYVAGECSGMDDMFPTIDTCYYDRFPWEGVKMADHGEVWSLPWQNTVDQESIHFAVNGVRFPYRLEKSVRFVGENILRLDYSLTNPTPFDFEFVWAAHPLFCLEEGVEVVLPQGIKSIICTFDIPGRLGNYGDEFPWPIVTEKNGAQKDLRMMRPKAVGDCYKYYIKDKLPEGWCGLKYHHSDFSLVMSFPLEHVPYLGILPNEGGWQDIYNIFLEPCTAPFDRPDAARYRNQGSTVKGGSTYAWHLNLTLAAGTGFQRAREDGTLEAD